MKQNYTFVKEYFLSADYKKYSAKIPVATKEHNKVSIKQLPQGFTIIENIGPTFTPEFGSPIISYFAKKIDVTDPTPVRAPEFSLKEKRRQSFRNYLKLWRSVFESNEDIIYSNQDLSVRMDISKPIDTFSTFDNRDEIYFPLAFLNKNTPIGGAYICLWKCGNDQLPVSSQHLPVSTFHTGGCRFGSTLYGIDDKFQKHSLTEPKYRIPEGRIITSIENNVELHPEELLYKESFINLIPLMKTLAKNSKLIVKHQIPLENYILYGMEKYLNKQMTEEAFASYIKEVKLRTKEHEFRFKNIAIEYGFEIEFCSSLSALNFDVFSEKTFMKDLFNQLNLKNQLLEDKDGKKTIKSLFLAIVNYLASLNNDVGEIWKIIKNTIQKNLGLINTEDLLQINYLDYSAMLALIKNNRNKKVCSLLPSQERHVGIGYKKLFSQKFGSILCMNYLPSLHVCIEEYNNSIFYLKDYIQEVNALLDAGVATFSALQTAAVALDSPELSRYATERIWQIMLMHSNQSTANGKRKSVILDTTA